MWFYDFLLYFWKERKLKIFRPLICNMIYMSLSNLLLGEVFDLDVFQQRNWKSTLIVLSLSNRAVLGINQGKWEHLVCLLEVLGLHQCSRFKFVSTYTILLLVKIYNVSIDLRYTILAFFLGCKSHPGEPQWQNKGATDLC